jgi:hypothetical protein
MMRPRWERRPLQDERERLLDPIETQFVRLVATELRAPYHTVADASLGDHVDDSLVHCGADLRPIERRAVGARRQ